MTLQDRSHTFRLLSPGIYTGGHPAVMLFAVLIAVVVFFAYPEFVAWAPWVQTLGDALVREPDKGAAAALMPTGMTAADGNESVDSEPMSIAPSAPASSLSGATSKGGGGGGGCFITTSQGAFNQDIMNGLAFLGVVVILWRLIMKIKSRGRRAGRRSPTHRGGNSVFDETTDLGFRVMTEKGNLVVAGTDDRAGQQKQASDLPEEPPAIVDSSPY